MTDPAAPSTLESADAAFDAGALERALGRHVPTSWTGWRLGGLAAATMLGAWVLLLLAHWVAATPSLPSDWQPTARQQITLMGTSRPELAPVVGRTLQSLEAPGQPALAVDALVMQRSPRWQVDDQRRRQLVEQQAQLTRTLAGGRVTLRFGDGTPVDLAVLPRGWRGLGLLYWPLAALALLLLVAGVAAWLARPTTRNALYGAMAAAQAGQIGYIALQTVPGLGLPEALFAHEMTLRLTLDGITAAAAVHLFALHPRRLQASPVVALGAWAGAGALVACAWVGSLPAPWWWAQAMMLGFGGAALAVSRASSRAEPNPLTAALRRLGGGLLATLALLTLGAALAGAEPEPAPSIVAAAAVSWTLFFALLLLLAPLLSQSRRWLREVALLAGVATSAVSLDLLFVTVFAIAPFPALTLAVCLALAAYAGARQRILQQLLGGSELRIERAFDLLYRSARELQQRPQDHADLLTRLFGDLFGPLQTLTVDHRASSSHVLSHGAALLVPLRDLAAGQDDGPSQRALVLRFAQGGRRLFTREDAVLADRMLEQLGQVVAFDRAVESGRREERLRIAQDLHDDIGARLLTLMYQSPSPEMEDYLRHTLKDLKTLTRGLAAAEHRLSDAAAEWKADLAQRFHAAQVELSWTFDADADPLLSMSQWSALTRLLRELASNVIAHAGATEVEVGLCLKGRQLDLRVADDGVGKAPEAWAHGLGLGGVRKRTKALGGEVLWRENIPRGIVCEVRVPAFGARPPAAP
jgi:signal transduction histidine kinase